MEGEEERIEGEGGENRGGGGENVEGCTEKRETGEGVRGVCEGESRSD